jgi:hypothetical protein
MMMMMMMMALTLKFIALYFEKLTQMLNKKFGIYLTYVFILTNVVTYSKNVSPCISHIKVTEHVFV